MFDKLNAVEAQYERLMAEMSDPAVQADTTKFRSHSKALSEMQPLVEKFREYKEVVEQLTATEGLMKDPGHARARAGGAPQPRGATRRAPRRHPRAARARRIPTTRRTSCSKSAPARAETRRRSLRPICSACTSRYAERQGWRVEVLNLSENGSGGTKEVTAIIEGTRRLQPAEVRQRRPPGPARARDRSAAAASTRRPRPSPCFPKPRKWTSTSTPRICASTRSARAVPAGRASTRPIRRSGSPTSRPAPSCRSRTRSRRSRTARRR